MRGADFPDVPASYAAAEPYFAKTLQIGGFQGGALQVAFVLSHITPTTAALDVVCASGFRGRWATRRVLGAVHDLAFRQLKLKYLWAEARNPIALRACVQAGFVCTQPEATAPALVILTPDIASKKFKFADMESQKPPRDAGA